ncbi:MAG TPA: FHA domain-containing protein [Thermoanaerobaculia bacterium]|nr:FHA domain-containing protein [Thermoanaerobaculia bacterium]
MATLSLVSVDGLERKYELSHHEPFRLGRDPANDAVIRDAKVSRNHAEIRFEKGFFVLHDLSSANGTFVNGHQIRVAPLIDGAQVRFGNSCGTFSASGLSASSRMDTEEDVMGHTVSVPRFGAAGRERDSKPQRRTRTAEFPMPAPEPDTEDLSEQVDDSKRGRKTKTDPGFSESHYEIEGESLTEDSGTVRDAAQTPLFYYYAPGRIVSLVTGSVAAIVVFGGVGATLFLLAGSRIAGAVAASVLTALFATLIVLLIPRRNLFLFRDRQMQEVALTIRQDSRFAFPRLRFSAASSDGLVVGSIQKSSLSNLGRHRWWIFERERTSPIGYAIEESLPTAYVRKVLGNFSPLFRTDLRIYAGESPAGWIRRRAPQKHQLLDLSEDASCRLDRRMGLALAVVISAVD